MSFLKKIFTLGKSVISQVEDGIEESQGIRILEQQIRDAKQEMSKAGGSRVDLLARVKLSQDKIAELQERKAILEAKILEAMQKDIAPELLNEVAEEIARLENTIDTEQKVLGSLEASRTTVENSVALMTQRIAQFEQQLEVIKATEAMQRARQAVTTSTTGASDNVVTAAESLKRIRTRQAERQARLNAAEQLSKQSDGRALDDKLAEAGIGSATKTSAGDVLARLQKTQKP